MQRIRIWSKEHDLGARTSFSFSQFVAVRLRNRNRETQMTVWVRDNAQSRARPITCGARSTRTHTSWLRATRTTWPRPDSSVPVCCAHSPNSTVPHACHSRSRELPSLTRANLNDGGIVRLSLCPCACLRMCVYMFFCALSFGKQETQIETQAETSFPLWRDIALHLRTERNRSGSFSRSLEQPPQQPPPVCSGSGSASARHLPAGVPLASHREKVYFMNSHKYWDWVLEIRLGQPGPATCSFGAFATATDTGILAHWQNSPAST